MNEELEKELMRLNKLWCNYKTHLKYCPNEITKQEKQGFIIFDYFDKLKVELSKTQQENQQLKERIDKAIKYIEAEGISFLNIAGQRIWCGKHSADYILPILRSDK